MVGSYLTNFKSLCATQKLFFCSSTGKLYCSLTKLKIINHFQGEDIFFGED